VVFCFLPSAVTISISVAPSTTWAFVSAIPDESTITPEPRLRCVRSRGPPKKRRKNSSPKNSSIGVRGPPNGPRTTVTVLMLMTDGLTTEATWRNALELSGVATGRSGTAAGPRGGAGAWRLVA
jgi:hypothetical protein